MKYFLIAGEASGDLHGSYLIKALRQADPQAQICAWGGDLMQAAGAAIAQTLPRYSIYGVYRSCQASTGTSGATYAPAAATSNSSPPMPYCSSTILDLTYALPLFAIKRGMPILLYGAKVWAWKANRVQLMRQYIEQLYAILPFEPDFYRKHGWNKIPIHRASPFRRAQRPQHRQATALGTWWR